MDNTTERNASKPQFVEKNLILEFPLYGRAIPQIVRVSSYTFRTSDYADISMFMETNGVFRHCDGVLIPVENIPDTIKALAKIIQDTT